MLSRRRVIAATDESLHSTAMRIAFTRSVLKMLRLWWPSSIGPAAGPMPPSMRNTRFSLELAALGNSGGGAPDPRWRGRERESLFVHHGFRYAIFPRRGGRWPELGTAADREWVGRFLGRIHGVGRAGRFAHRGRLSVADLGRNARDFVLAGDWMPDYLATKYEDLTDSLLEEVEAQADGWGGARLGRILGDCHRGNILWTDLGPHFVDLDDCLTGPAIQDIWMLLAGSQQEMRTDLTDLLKGYEQFLPFDRGELALIEPLRALRMIHYSAWLARRWDDPAFPKAFPWFAEPRYWEEQYRALEEQLAAVMGPRLEL